MYQSYIEGHIKVSHGLDAQSLQAGSKERLVFYTHSKALAVSGVCPCLSPCSFWQQGWILQALAFAGFWSKFNKEKALTGVRLEGSRETEVEIFLFALVLDGSNLLQVIRSPRVQTQCSPWNYEHEPDQVLLTLLFLQNSIDFLILLPSETS